MYLEQKPPALGWATRRQFSAPSQHLSSKFPGRLPAAQAEKPRRALRAFRCGFAQPMPKSREANSFCLRQTEAPRGSCCKEPSFSSCLSLHQSREQGFFSPQIPSTLDNHRYQNPSFSSPAGLPRMRTRGKGMFPSAYLASLISLHGASERLYCTRR